MVTNKTYITAAAASSASQAFGATAARAADARAPSQQTTTNVEILRDYWPKTVPLGHEGEYRVRAGEAVTLPVDEAMDLVEAGVARRRRG